MNVIITHSIGIELGRTRVVRASFEGGDQHLIQCGLAGVTLCTTTAELAEWIDDLRSALAECRVADMHRVMPQLSEVAQ